MNIAHAIRHYKRRIAKCYKNADKAYRNNHNIIGMNFLNMATYYEIKLKELQNDNLCL